MSRRKANSGALASRPHKADGTSALHGRRLLAIAFSALPIALAAFASRETTDFAKDVAPIFKARCSCHQGDDPPAGLDLTNPNGFVRVVVPGHPEQSILVSRLLGQGGKPQMPMGFAPLSEAEIGKVKAWIASGASTKGAAARHWAYEPIKSPPVPLAPGSWVRNPVDSFIFARLKKEGLKPSPEAPKETLARRAYLDITGLTPSPEQMDAYLADKRPDAYERLVDKLLASPHYGEHMAQKWMDLARYADSDGYEKDLNRTAWKYRDWVIDAFNRNQPYDKFVIDQLAGDLTPHPSIDQLVATGFNRNTMLNLEGGVDQAEAHFEVELDRVATTSTVFLGSTMACARCHDHKYDPFTQKDFYSMMAFFDNSVIEPKGNAAVGEEKWYEPFIEVPSPEQAALRTKLLENLAEAKASLVSKSASLADERHKWAAEAANFKTEALVGSTTTPQGLNAIRLSDNSIRIEGPSPDRAEYTFSAQVPKGTWTGLRLEALPDSSLPGNGPGRSDGGGNFVLTDLRAKVDGAAIKLSSPAADFEQPMFGVAGAIDSDPQTGWGVAGQTGKPHDAIFPFEKPLTGAGELRVTLSMNSKYVHHTIGRFRLSLTSQEQPARFAIPQAVRENLGDPDKKEVANFYESISPTLQPIRKQIDEEQAQLDKLKDEIPTAMVLRDKAETKVLKTNLRVRGEFLNKGPEVPACTPHFLPAMTSSLPANRFGLAMWIASPSNPLTARVEANRLWENCFGRGLVETAEDFGTQGSPPSHPELLDWLASEFIRRNWDMKAMLRLIVTSATYRQSSGSSKELQARDPQNILFARGPRYRLEAETIRDVALCASGLLNPKIGGPSVMPSQPDGVWNTPYSGERWMVATGSDRYRRALYTFWKRTAPYPAFLAFDATSREACTARRIRTNTPLQALALLNDEAVIDASKALAKKMAGQREPLVYGFRASTGRAPDAAELARLKTLLSTLEKRYSSDPAAMKKIGDTTEQAAMTMLASVLLNLDETISKE